MADTAIYFIAGIIVLLGIVQLAFPNFVRSVDRDFNDLNGIQTNQGEAYEAGRIFRGVLFILIGIALMFLPSLLF